MNLVLSIAGVLAIGTMYVLLPVFVQIYRRLRGTRVVTCPETAQPTVVMLDARRGAAAALMGRSALRVRQCTRWAVFPWHHGCNQACLKDATVEAVGGGPVAPAA